MPRLLAAEYVYSGAMDDCYNEYVTAATPTPSLPPTIQQPQPIATPQIVVPSQQICVVTNMPANTLSNVQETTTSQNLNAAGTQQIHTISSSDDDEEIVLEQNTIEEEITNISSDECGDFEGFDDFTTPNSSGVINDASQEDLNVSSNYLKRHSYIDFNDYREDSEGVVEAIEVEDDEEIAVGEDGEIFYRTIDETTPKKSQAYRCEPHTPNKRKKQENDNYFNAISPAQLKTPPDQIVEVNSDSTTNSLKQKRQQINTKFQLNLSQQQPQKIQQNLNKCSTESTSEFPVSSPSNPQQPRGGKYPPRPPLLKNTLPADSFERQLAMITACNPQMSLEEKIQTWQCDEELSDVEDVNRFDEEFKRVEKQKKLEMKQREKSVRVKNTESKNYDFFTFRQMLLSNMNEQRNTKLKTNNQTVGGFVGVSGNKCIESSGSESSKSVVQVDERPSTSAVAQQQLQQRRCKPTQINLETGEPKKRLVKEQTKRNQNSTTPPQTSSSDNERECFQNTKIALNNQNKLNSRQIGQEKVKLLQPSSSEEAISQEIPKHRLMKFNNKVSPTTLKNIQIATTTNHLLAGKGETLNNANSLTKNPRILTDEEIDSVFRLHRLNRERDKFNSSPPNVGENLQPTSIIQMRFDFADEHKSELLMEKKQELFKTPIIPQKYLANTPHTDTKDRISPTLSAGNSLKNTQEFKHEISSEKSLKTNNSNHNNDEVLDVNGIYHQQHEFCNYLGLTGMSTATAMANAVAELAQCNLARRSMRVLRQQQQEKRDKSAKEEKQLEALKMKQLKEIRKRERGGSDNYTPDMLEEDIMIKSEGSHSQTSEALTPNKEPKKKTSNSNTKSSTKSQNSITIIKKEPEIKILCHIAAKNKEKAEQLAKDCIKDITQPIKETLIKQAKLQATDKTLEEFKNKIKKEDKTDGKNETEQFNRSLRSPRLTRSKTPIIATKTTTTRTKTQKQNEFKNEHQVNETFKEQCKLESSTSLIEKNDKSPCLKRDNVMIKQNSLDDDINLRNPDIHLISSSSSNIIQQKLQMALEESRKTKPSIFIVQSLESKKEQTLNKNTLDEVTFETEDNLQAVTKTVKKSFQNGKQFYKKRNLKKSYKTNKNKKYPTCKRKLRNRKIIVIKTLKPKQKSLETLKEIKRELRSSPRHHQQEKQEKSNNKFLNSETKSYRTVHTETKDLELYLKHHNTQTKTRLMAKASALLERSRRMSLRINNTGVNSLPNNTNIKSKLTSSHIQRSSKLNLHGTRTQILKSSRLNNSEKFNTTSISQHQQPTSSNLMLDNDNVVVSSTTNNYDERPVLDSLATTQSPTITLRSLHNTASYVIASSPIQTKDQYTQCSIHRRVQYFNSPPLATQFMRNPLKSDYGKVLYIYLELDILIVIQESLISFWKCSKLINILSLMPNSTTTTKMECSHQMAMKQQEQGETLTTTTSSSCVKQSIGGNCCNTQMRQPASSSSSNFIETSNCGEWLHLGELRRLNYDFEISVPYANRMCLHNSTPIYLEMRAKQLPKNQRDCNLLSMYINIYYYHDEDMIAKCNSIALDTIQSDINSVNYTTLVDSRYFIMTWPQENLLGKTRSGLCKYSLTPQLDTLASIREFKSMRHTIRYLECMSDDKLIGFGDTQITIWDHRSGDVLMNFDLEIPLGKNLGSIYFSSHDIEQNNMLILHQYRDSATSITSTPQLMTLACTVTHNQPSYRLLQEINLPQSAFKNIQCAINNGDHLVITGENNEELWISTTNPALINIIQTTKNSKRFYSREKTHLIELTEQTLSVNTIANHLMQLAAAKLSLN
ncbi:uncharacterized protein ACRADG_006239 [Cochliomyia hominivorax]